MMSHVCWEMLGIYPGENNIDVETYGFPRKVICKWYQMVGFPHLCSFTGSYNIAYQW